MKALWFLALALALVAPAAQAAAPIDPSRLASISSSPGARAPMDGVFQDQTGRAVTLAQLSAGKPMVLVPVQHGCRNLCGLTLTGLASAIAGQPLRPGRDFALVAFGIDPRETPADAMASEQRLGGGPGVSALVGGAAQVQAVTNALGYRYSWMAQSQQYAHLSAIAVLAPDGRLVAWLQGLGASPAALHAALARARTQASFEPGGGIRILCFHLDPPSGRDAAAALAIMRWAAAGSALALAAGIGIAFAQGRRRGRAS